MANQAKNQGDPKRGLDVDKKKEIAKKAGESVPLKKQPEPAAEARRKFGETRNG